MLPRRFALIRHVDYSGGAGTGVIAYGVAFDDGQVVLRWSSAHRATSVLDSIEDLIAAHGHGETTSIEWIDAAPGKADAPAPSGRRARRPATSSDEPAGDAAQVPKQPSKAQAETPDASTAPQPPQPDGPAHTRPAHAAPASADAGPTTGPVPTAPVASTAPAHPATEPAQPATPAEPTPAQRAPAQPAVPAQSPPSTAAAQPPAPERPAATAKPTPAQPATPAAPAPQPPPAQPATPAAEQPAASTHSWEPGRAGPDPSTEPNVAASLGVSRLSPKSPANREPVDEVRPPTAPRPATHGSPASNGAAPAPDAERRSRHEAIATQPMSAEFTDEHETRRSRRGGPPSHESPRSIFEEAEQPARPDLRLASSNGRAPEPDEPDEPADDPPDRSDFAGFFATGHQHLETVTGLLDLPAGLNKRGRDAESEQDAISSRRNGRHRGE